MFCDSVVFSRVICVVLHFLTICQTYVALKGYRQDWN